MINIQNTDGNECSKWCLVRYKSARITKSDKFIAKKIGFKDMKIQVQTRDIKNFKKSMYEHTLHRGTKHFCRYCLQAFSTAQKLKYHVKDCFKIYSKQTIIMP